MEILEGLRWTDQIPAGRAWRTVLPDRRPYERLGWAAQVFRGLCRAPKWVPDESDVLRLFDAVPDRYHGLP